MEKELRRKQVTLVTLGTGVILFGVWSVVKSLLYFRTNLFADLDTQVEPELLPYIKLATVVIVALFVLADLGIRLKIGRRARAEGMGRRQKNGYLILAALIAFSRLYLCLDYVVSVLVDLSSTVLLAELIITALRVRKLRAMSEG